MRRDILEFKEKINSLSSKIDNRKHQISDEANTKKSLIEPFISLLGFDISEPSEVKLEFTADYGIKKGEKVDYAIFKNGSLIIFLEAKSVTENLSNHNNQLARYYASTPNVKFAVLSNGIEYKFFTDLKHTNLMDIDPFFEFDITNLKDSEIETIEKFRKEKFNNETLSKLAKNLVYKSELDKKLKELLIEPNEKFIRLLIEEIGEENIDSELIERFKPLVRKSISNTILELSSKSFEVKEVVERYEKPVEIKKEVPKTTFEVKNEIKIPENNNGDIFYCNLSGISLASGRLLSNRKFLVLKGSRAVLEDKSSVGPCGGMRAQLLKKELLKKENGYLTFVEDYVFSSPSSAAGVILARSSNGWREWINSKSETLDKVYRKK